MNLLIIGGSGHVGSIIRPALEARYNCYHYDLRAIPEVNGHGIVGDINDPAMLRHAMKGMQCVINLALGAGPDGGYGDVDACFKVNAQGGYQVLDAALAAGVRRFVYASTLSVYRKLKGRPEGFPVDERTAPDAWNVYGLTKRIGEFLCEAAVQRRPEMGIVALRLMWPRNEAQWPGNEFRRGTEWHPVGPHDLRRAFVAAVEATAKPGFAPVQITGDLTGEAYPNTAATQKIGWAPEGR